MVADIRFVEGPNAIKAENGRLRNYVMLNVRDRDIVGFVDEARQAIKPIEEKLAGSGMSIQWSGEFEHQVRARQTMAVIFPMVILVILFSSDCCAVDCLLDYFSKSFVVLGNREPRVRDSNDAGSDAANSAPHRCLRLSTG